jgi:hypothetical protein
VHFQVHPFGCYRTLAKNLENSTSA